MDFIRRDDPRYDEDRAVFNAMIDRRPSIIAKCSTPADVRAALAHAADHDLAVAVRSGGHVSTTGVAGLTLGGGSGWLERKHGLACDNLVSVDLVTADGREVTASEDEHPELFWALHGGGGNFGVATTLEFALHDLPTEVLAGLLLWPGDEGGRIAREFRDVAYDAPEELGSALVFLTGPPEEFVPTHLQGHTVAAIAFMLAGDVADGMDAVAGLPSDPPTTEPVTGDSLPDGDPVAVGDDAAVEDSSTTPLRFTIGSALLAVLILAFVFIRRTGGDRRGTT